MKAFASFAVRRLVTSILVLAVVSVIIFFLGRLLPGDPVATMLASQNISDPDLVEQLRAQYGLDAPPTVQYWRWITNAIQGDFGKSIRKEEPVSQLLWRGVANTAWIAVPAVVLVVVVGWVGGIIAAMIHYRGGDSVLDRVFAQGPILMLSIPSFSLAVIAILILGVRLGWLPTGSMSSARLTGFNLGDRLKHLILPAIVLGWNSIGSNWRLARNKMIEVLNEDYIRTGYAKGLRESTIFYVHALRNSLIPLLTSAGLLFGSLLTGSFILEGLFNWQGIGYLMVESVLYRDYPVVQGGTLLLASIYLIINFVVDALYAAVDPRIRYE